MPMLSILGKKHWMIWTAMKFLLQAFNIHQVTPHVILVTTTQKLVREKLMSVMPSFYIDGVISKVNIKDLFGWA